MTPIELLTYYGLTAATLQVAGIARCLYVPGSRGGMLCAFGGSMMGVGFALMLFAMVYGR